ncbi:hypothetical protein ACA910_013668 [Epithemia clementina (nom. ined.)]
MKMKLRLVLVVYYYVFIGKAAPAVQAFATSQRPAGKSPALLFQQPQRRHDNDHHLDNHTRGESQESSLRRTLLQQLIIGATTAAASWTAYFLYPMENAVVWAAEAQSTVEQEGGDNNNMFSPKFVQTYSDFTSMDDGGWSYRDVTPGKAGTATAALGDRVVFDWSGYTIGYFGRPFQAKGGPQGGAFDKDLDYERTVLGSKKIIPGLERALLGMQAGGVRQIVLPYGPLSYPKDDASHERVGPKPSTFSGQRALNFVLENPRIDRTLLFNVKVIRVDKPDGRGGFNRG